MVSITAGFSENSEVGGSMSAGPPLDYGAPYSRIGEQEFHLLCIDISSNFNGAYDDLPNKIYHRPF